MTAPKVQLSSFDLEGAIHEIHGASIVLTEIAESILSGKNIERDENGFRVFRLNDEQIRSFFYISYAVQDHARELHDGFHAKPAAKAA